MKHRIKGILVSAIFLLIAQFAVAQADTGRILGVVHDQTKAVVPGASVVHVQYS